MPLKSRNLQGFETWRFEAGSRMQTLHFTNSFLGVELVRSNTKWHHYKEYCF